MDAAHHTHHPRPETEAPPHRRLILALLCLGQAMLIVDITVVNVALPSIGADLDLSRAALTWVVTGYTLCFGGLMLLGGRLADLFGRRRIVLTGLAVFTIASLTTGLAVNGEMLLGGRLAQGVGAALLSPAALSTITTLFHGSARHKALAAWAAVGGSGAAVGVLIGGLLTGGPGWEWVFYINVPIGVAVFIGLAARLPKSEAVRDRRLDVPGALAVTAATALLVFGLVRAGDDGWTSATTMISLSAAAALYLLFFAIESWTTRPLINIVTLAKRTVITGVFLMLVATALLISFFFLGSLYLQHALGRSALETGLLFLPAAVAVTVGSHLAGNLLGRVGPRVIALAGLTLATAGAALLTGLDTDSNVYADFLPGFTLAAFALGPLFVAATTTAMSNVNHHEAGMVSGAVNTFHELGGSIGVAVMSTVAAASLGAAVPTTAGFTDAFTVCAVVAAAALPLAFWLIPPGRVKTSGMPHAH